MSVLSYIEFRIFPTDTHNQCPLSAHLRVLTAGSASSGKCCQPEFRIFPTDTHNQCSLSVLFHVLTAYLTLFDLQASLGAEYIGNPGIQCYGFIQGLGKGFEQGLNHVVVIAGL